MVYFEADFALLPKSWRIHYSFCCSTPSSQIKSDYWRLGWRFVKPQGREEGWEPKRGLNAIKRGGTTLTKAMAIGHEIMPRTSQTPDPAFSRPMRQFCFKNHFYFYLLCILPTRNWFCLLSKGRRCTVQLCAGFTEELCLNNVFHTFYFWWIIYLQTLIHIFCFRVACLYSLIALDCILLWMLLCCISLYLIQTQSSTLLSQPCYFELQKHRSSCCVFVSVCRLSAYKWVFVIGSIEVADRVKGTLSINTFDELIL